MIKKNSSFSILPRNFFKPHASIILSCISTGAIFAENKDIVNPIDNKNSQIEFKQDFLSFKKVEKISDLKDNKLSDPQKDLEFNDNDNKSKLFLEDLLKFGPFYISNGITDAKGDFEINDISFNFDCGGSKRYKNDEIIHKVNVAFKGKIESDQNKIIDLQLNCSGKYDGKNIKIDTITPAIKFKNSLFGFLDSISFLVKGGSSTVATKCSSDIPYNRINSSTCGLSLDNTYNFKFSSSIKKNNKKYLELIFHTPSTIELNKKFNKLIKNVMKIDDKKDAEEELLKKPWPEIKDKNDVYFVKNYGITAFAPVYGHISIMPNGMIPLLKKFSVSGGLSLFSKDYNIKDSLIQLPEMNFRPRSISFGFNFELFKNLETGLSFSYNKGSILSTCFNKPQTVINGGESSSSIYLNNYFIKNNFNFEYAIKFEKIKNCFNLFYFKGASFLLNACGFKGMDEINFKNNDKIDSGNNSNFFSEDNKNKFIIKDINAELSFDINIYNLFNINPAFGIHVLQYLSSKKQSISNRSIDNYLGMDYKDVDVLDPCASLGDLFKRFITVSISIALL